MFEPTIQPPSGALPPPPPPIRGRSPAQTRAYGTEALLDAVRLAQRRQLWLEGVIVAAASLLALLLLAGFAAYLSVGLSRLLLVLAPLSALGALGYFGLWRGRRTVGDDARTARLVGRRIPEVSLDLLAAVELRRELDKPDGFSADLAKAYLAAEDRRAERLKVEQVVDPVTTRRFVQLGGAALLVLLVVLAFGWDRWRAGVGGALTFATAAEAARSREPITGDVELTYRYPAYTGLPPRTVPGSTGEISALTGTEVVLRTRADRDVARASLDVNGVEVPLEVTDRRELAGSFVVDRSGSYAVVFRTARGREVARGPQTPINAEADQTPQVAIRTPGEQLEIDPGEKVTLRYDVSDDHGIGELELVYRPPGRAEDVRQRLRHDEGRRSRDQFTWDLGALDLKAGDRISYRLEAKDNDTVSGPKLGVSRTHQLKVYSAAEHRREAVRKAQQLWEKLVTHLADRLEGPDRADPKDAKLVERHQAVDQAGLQLVAELREVAQEIARQRDAPAELWGALSNIADGMRPRVQATMDARRMLLRYVRLEVPDTSAGRRLARATEAEIAGLEKDVLYLESLIDRQKLDDLRQMAKELANERRELASLVEEYQKTQDPQLREDILLRMQELQQRISELMQRMSELASGIRDEHLNAEALQELMDDKNVTSQLDDVQRLMREGKTEEALKLLQQMAMDMEQMLEQLEQGAEGDPGEYDELAQKFEEFMSDLEQTRSEQKKVADDTKQIRDRYKEQLKERVQKRAAELREQLKKETAALRKDYGAVDPGALNPNADQPLEKIEAELQSLEHALEVDDFDLAAEAAQQAERAAEDLAAYGEQQRRMDEMFDRPQELQRQSKRLADQLAKDARRTQELSKKLQSLFPPPGSMLSEGDQQKLQQLEGQQRQLERKAQGLGEKLDEMQELAPVFGPQAREQLDGVAQRMGDAAERLQGRDPARGHGEQRAALDQLEQFRDELAKQQQQQRGRGGRRMPLPMFAQGQRQPGDGLRSDEKVELPDEDAFQAPKEFRKDILDAMKEGTPEKYRDQVKRYYEELVK